MNTPKYQVLTRVRLYGVLPRFVHTSWGGTDRRGWVFWLRKLRLLWIGTGYNWRPQGAPGGFGSSWWDVWCGHPSM